MYFADSCHRSVRTREDVLCCLPYCGYPYIKSYVVGKYADRPLKANSAAQPKGCSDRFELSGQSRGYRERAICFASGILRWSSAMRLESLGCVLRKSELEAEAGADPEERDAIFCQKAVAALES